MSKYFSIILFFASTLAFASEVQTDKTEIINNISEKLSGIFSKRFEKATVKPKVYIAEVNSTATSLDTTDISLIADKFESTIIKSAVILDREKTSFTNKEESFQQSGATADVLAMGTKLGATHLVFIALKDQAGKLNSETEKVTVTAKLTIVEITTGRKIVSELFETKFNHREYGESHYTRNFISTTLGIASVASLGAAAGFGYYASQSKAEYDKADNANDAKAYREKTENYKKFAYASLGTAALTFGLKLWVDSGSKDLSTYHEYEFTLIPSANGNLFAGGFSCHF